MQAWQRLSCNRDAELMLTNKKRPNYSGCHSRTKLRNPFALWKPKGGSSPISFGGGKGTFDSSFVINYCKRHKLKGFKELTFDNIKNYVPKAPFGAEGQLSKDNLCRLLGINGVEDVHTSSNDCLLEWKLFEKFYGKKLFFDGNDLFSFDENYILPVSKSNASPELRQYKGIEPFNIKGHLTEIFQYSFSRKIFKGN